MNYWPNIYIPGHKMVLKGFELISIWRKPFSKTPFSPHLTPIIFPPLSHILTDSFQEGKLLRKVYYFK